MKSAFIVTSALNTSIGLFDTKTRIHQTEKTLNSIQNYAPNSKIIFVEGGEKSDNLYLNSFLEQVRKKVYLFGVSNDLKTPTNFGSSKSINDIILTKSALEAFINKNEYVDRIFRISGRYQLSPVFSLDLYKNIDKYIFKKRKDSYIPNSKIKYYYESRLWSLPYNKAEKTIFYLDKMIKDLVDANLNNQYLDFEHVLFDNIPEEEIHELNLVHVFGVITSNGNIIYD